MTRVKVYMALVGLCVAVLVICLRFGVRGSGAAQARSAAPRAGDDRVALLHEQVGELRGELDRMRHRQEGTLAQITMATRSADGGTSSDDLDHLAESREPQPSEQEKVAEVTRRLDERIQTEPSDPTWDAEVRREITTVLSGRLASSRLVLADCRATLCRAQVSHANEEARDDFLDALPMTRPFSTEGFVRTTDVDGAPRTVVYFARPGLPLND
jgi:hypothetical protein